jgi:hypothetical protein
MENDEFEKLATAIWQGNEKTVDALKEMDADDLQRIEKALRDKYKVDIALNAGAEQIHAAVAKARSPHSASSEPAMERTLREANAEDS